MKFSCPNCDSEKIAMEKRPGGWFHCQDCHYSWQPYPVRFGFSGPQRKQTVFETITQSPDVLSEKLVILSYIPKKIPLTDIRGRSIGYKSVLRPVWKSGVTEEIYSKKAEAIAATLARLKEVANEN